MTKKKKNPKEKKIDSLARKKVIQFYRENPDKEYNYHQVAAATKVKKLISGKKIMALLDRLVEEGTLHKVPGYKYKWNGRAPSAEGPIDIVKDGSGYVTIEGMEEDVFIPQEYVGNAFPGDTVSIKIKGSMGRSGKAKGEVIKVVERSRSTFVGTLSIKNEHSFFIPSDSRMPFDFFISPGNLGRAVDGDKVLVKFIKWEGRSPEGKVIRVLGKPGDNETEMHAILFEYGFVPEFPEAIELEAAQIPKEISEEEVKKRRDFRGITTFTIDPLDAKDFDDAISYRKLENGNVEVGVHIADVSHFLREGSKLDIEAKKRATSVYLVDRTVPMLPEVLSNNLCSLRPNEDKLVFSAVFELDQSGKVVDRWFGKAIIHSDKRFTYEEAQDVLEKGEGLFFEELEDLNRLAHVLRVDRFKTGSISFEDSEVKFVLDEKGKPTGVYRKIRKDTHKMVEDYMLLANKEVSLFVNKLKGRDKPPAFIYRIHDLPDGERLMKLKNFVNAFGYDINVENPQKTAESMSQLMAEVEGKPEAQIVGQVCIRTMAKAIYSMDNIGHYGLGFSFYSHFTSPIRRYPDLIAHRMLFKYLNKDFSVNYQELAKDCKHSSAMERKAINAERASTKYKQVEFLETKIGEDFEGVISGVKSWGVYVELIDSKCEGMVSLRTLEDDVYEVDEAHYRAVGIKTRRIIRLGDTVLVRVKATNMLRRTIDFEMVEYLTDHSELQEKLAAESKTPKSRKKK